MIRGSINTDSSVSSVSFPFFFFSLSFCVAPARTSSTGLDGSGNSKNPCLVFLVLKGMLLTLNTENEVCYSFW